MRELWAVPGDCATRIVFLSGVGKVNRASRPAGGTDKNSARGAPYPRLSRRPSTSCRSAIYGKPPPGSARYFVPAPEWPARCPSGIASGNEVDAFYCSGSVILLAPVLSLHPCIDGAAGPLSG